MIVMIVLYNVLGKLSFIQRAGQIKETNHKKLAMRQAAIIARQRVNQLLKENALTVLFTIT